jgi:hypothetical protein
MREYLVSLLLAAFFLGLFYLVGYTMIGKHPWEKRDSISYRVICFLPSQMGEVPVTRLILHDIKAERPTADLVGSDGSYRPMSGELCFFKREGAKK